MPPFIRFLITRFLSIPITLVIITAILYGIVMLTPPETRATLYLPENSRMTEKQLENYINLIIERYHLKDPFPVQYAYYLKGLAEGNWGYSPTMNDQVLNALIERTPATAELTLYSLLFFIPLGILSGVMAGWRQNKGPDHAFRLAAFTATSLPPFILALILLSIFYVGLYWFPPERLSVKNAMDIRAESWNSYTGMLTIDGFLNGRGDISADAARHLVLPVITLSLLHWATLGRVTRASLIEELDREYIIAARARGLSERIVVWRHAFRNTLAPAITSSAISAAALITGVFVIEIIFSIHGVSALIVNSMTGVPDAPAALGFAIYSVLVVLILMFALDIIQAVVDPRIRNGIL